MGSPDLTSITIKDFRSISGTVNIPLDAPIVLIHGVNGAGKSSVLSAIELALTGRAAGLATADGYQPRHLVHRGCPQSEVILTSQIDDELITRITVSAGGSVEGTPALYADDRRTFSERCYLAQSTVSRLLEIYQHKVGGESALTRFVKDLLGLDRLEALIDGLFAVGDVRRLRNLIPELAELEREEKQLSRDHDLASQARVSADRELEETRTRLAGVWTGLIPESGMRFSQMDALQLLALEVPSAPDASQTPSLEAARQELNGLLSRADVVPVAEQLKTVDLETRALDAATALSQWQDSVGEQFTRTLDRLNRKFPGLPTLSTGPTVALEAARDRVLKEIARVRAVLEADAAATRAISLDSEQLSKTQERIERLTAALQDSPERIRGLTGVLSELIPHLDGDICPVCERDYSEVADTSLADHLSVRVSSLNSEAKRLQGLVESLREARADERRLTTSLAERSPAQLSSESRLAERRTLAELTQDERALAALGPDVSKGDVLLAVEREAREALLRLRNATSTTAEVRQAASEWSRRLGAPPPAEAEAISDAIRRLLGDVERRLASVRANESQLSLAAALREELTEKRRQQTAAAERLTAVDSQLAQCRSRLSAFDHRRSLARGLASEAEQARARVVRQVFNLSLNQIWRDLFVRLVPSEPFVPAFRIVTGAGGKVAAELETRHRDGGTGGNPSYMLSAGNLNTGAVTLFLALHLSVNPRLPWLILDDPVQSMDEVHIAQFAALLRTLAKQQGKKVILAVHERSLFEYLSLELSPAFPEDKLITVELSRPDGGTTEANPSFITWNDDRALAAG